MTDFPSLALQGLQIVWINVLLSADNAVVIALACRGLDDGRRKWAIAGGSLAAVALRIVFTIFVVALLAIPFVKLASGVLLLWIAFDLVRDRPAETDVRAATSIWSAIRTIAVADAIMSLDNVVAVAAAARNSLPLIVFGIALSVPLIVFGSTMMLKLLERFPILVTAGAALLGWVAGEMMIDDPEVLRRIGPLPDHASLLAAAAGASLVLVAALVLRIRHGARRSGS